MVGPRPETRTGGRLRTLALVSIVLFCAGVAYGIVAARAGLFPVPQLGRLRRSLSSPGNGGSAAPAGQGRTADGRVAALTDEQAREIERLTALGYVSGSRPAGPRSGVTVHDEELAFDGLNFLTSGHAPAALERSPHSPLLTRAPEAGDIFHTNTIEVLDGRPREAVLHVDLRIEPAASEREHADHRVGRRPGHRGRA